MKDWSDLESGCVNHFNGHFAPGHGCNLKKFIRVVDGHE